MAASKTYSSRSFKKVILTIALVVTLLRTASGIFFSIKSAPSSPLPNDAYHVIVGHSGKCSGQATIVVNLNAGDD